MKIWVIKSKNNDWQFSTPCNNDQTKDVYWMDVGFKRGQQPLSDKVQLEVLDGFHSNYRKNDGTIVPKFIIMDWRPVEDKKDPIEESIKETTSKYSKPEINIEEKDLPFY